MLISPNLQNLHSKMSFFGVAASSWDSLFPHRKLDDDFHGYSDKKFRQLENLLSFAIAESLP